MAERWFRRNWCAEQKFAAGEICPARRRDCTANYRCRSSRPGQFPVGETDRSLLVRPLSRIGRFTRSVLDTAGDVLRLAFCLLELAFRLHFLVANRLPDLFLEIALELLAGADDAILVHNKTPCGTRLSDQNASRIRPVPRWF